MTWHRPLLLVLLAGCADFELADRVHGEAQPPKITSLASASTSADGGLAGFFGDPLVIFGEHLERVSVRIGGSPARVLDTPDGGTRLVVEIPDLGKAASSEVEVVAQGSSPFSEKHPLEFLGPGQLRTVRAGTQESLRVPTRAFGTIQVHVPAPCTAPDAGGLPCQDLAAVGEAARQVVLATGSSDFALPLALDFNLASAALEAPSTLLTATGLALPFRLVPSERLFPVVVVALDERGATHAATTALFQLADDSGWMLAGGAFQPLSLPSTNGRPAFAQLVLLPAAIPAADEVGRLVSLVMFQPDGAAAPTWALTSLVLRWTEAGGASFDRVQSALLEPRGQPQLVQTRTGVMLAGAVRLGADGKPEEGASALSQVVFTPLGWNLVPVRFTEKGGLPKTLEETVEAAPAEFELWSAAVHPEGGWLVATVKDPLTTAPRLLFARRNAAIFEMRSKALSLTAIVGYGFSSQGDPPALFGLEGLSGRVVRLDPDRLLPTAGYEVPGLLSATDLTSVGTSTEGRYLLVGDASGTVHRFSTESATFLPPLVSERKYGSFLVLSESSPATRLAMSEGLDREGGAAGQVTLSVSGFGTVALGGGRQATAAVELPVLEEGQRLRFAVASPGLEREHCGELSPCASDGRVQPECVQHQCRAPGELRITNARESVFESTRCALDTMIRGMASRADGEVVVATSRPAKGGMASPVSLHRLEGFPETCVRAQEVFAQPPQVTLTPSAEVPCGPARCEGPLPVVVLPDGREALILDGTLGVQVVDGAKAVAVAPPVELPGFVPVALAADTRPCRPGVVPVLAVAWRFLDGWGGTVTVYPLADAECRPLAPSPMTALVADVFELTGLSGLGLSPNGRQLLAVVDQGVARRVVSLDLARGTDGLPRSLALGRIGDLGAAARDFDPDPQPGRVAFSADGATAWTVLPGPGAVISME